ncbi:MAG: outer membrane beta-barrel protein, partial [bacterium]
ASKGANAHVVFPGSEGQIIIKLDYVEMPILAKFFLLNSDRWDIGLVVGPVFSKNIRRSVQYKGLPSFGDDFGHGHDFDRGLVFGSDFGVNLPKGKVILAPRYYLGFVDIDGIKNRSFSFMVGYAK